MRCARHLLRALDVVQALRHQLSGGRRKGAACAAASQAAVGRLAAELELLFFSPPLFGEAGVYAQMSELRDQLRGWQALRAPAAAPSGQAFARSLADSIDAAASALKATSDRFLGLRSCSFRGSA
jgi:hypothetical protein